MTAALLVAACGAALTLVAALVAVLARGRAMRRRQALLVDLAGDVGLATTRLARALDRMTGIRPRGLLAVGAPRSLEEVLGHALSAAVERSGADAAAARVEGPRGVPVSVACGDGVDSDLVESALAATGPGTFRAATVRWSYPPREGAAGLFRSATVVPIVEEERVTGALVAFASSESALGPTEERALRSIADEASPRLTAARRYEELDRRYLRDTETGARNRTAYETDLEHAVAHAQENAGPLSVVLLEIGTSHDAPAQDRVHRMIADAVRAVSHLCRRDEIVYRRRERQLVLLVRDADGTGAGAMAARLRDGVLTALAHSERVAVAAVHRRGRESADALDGRAAAALRAAGSAGARDEGMASRA